MPSTAATKPIDDAYALILYDIEMHGCINGVFRGGNSEIYNEILRKRSDAADVGDGLFSIYDGQFIDCDGLHNCEVRIAKHPTGYYVFEWYKGKNLIFKGIGYKMNDRQISVYYH